MKTIKNEKGVALLIVLILSVIILAMSAAMIYMATQGTRFSGMQKSYKTALEANIGGAEMMEHLILIRVAANINTFVTTELGGTVTTPRIPAFPAIPAQATSCWGTDAFGTEYYGILAKILTPTFDEAGVANWSALCDSNITIDPAIATSYDFSFQLGTAPDPVYDVFAKIVNTVEGNASMNTNLKKTGTGQNEEAVPHLGYLYSLEVLSVSALNPRERAKTSVLYEY